jgi:hypothetical protein
MIIANMMSSTCSKTDMLGQQLKPRPDCHRKASRMYLSLPGRGTSTRTRGASITLTHPRDGGGEGTGHDCPVGSDGRTDDELTKHLDVIVRVKREREG